MTRPRPTTSSDTAFFWDGLQRGELLAQCCSSCGTLRHPPGPACPACHSLEWEARPLSGRGRIHSWTVHRYPPHPSFAEPPVIVAVDLDEGVRLIANLLVEGDAPIEIGATVEAVFADQPEGWTVPQFRLR